MMTYRGEIIREVLEFRYSVFHRDFRAVILFNDYATMQVPVSEIMVGK